MEPIDFLDQTNHCAIKICGITTAAQGDAIVGLGADALGVNFWPSSKRFLDPKVAQDWLPDLCLTTTVVGVFVNPDPDEVVGHFENELLTVAQLHGDESPEFCRGLVERGIPVIKALSVGDTAELGDLEAFGTRYFLLDAAQEGYGGGGFSFDWNLAAEIIEAHPGLRFLLAGGLRPATVGKAVKTARPAGVDVASGVEMAPGIKDLGLVEDFVTLVRKAEA